MVVMRLRVATQPLQWSAWPCRKQKHPTAPRCVPCTKAAKRTGHGQTLHGRGSGWRPEFGRSGGARTAGGAIRARHASGRSRHGRAQTWLGRGAASAGGALAEGPKVVVQCGTAPSASTPHPLRRRKGSIGRGRELRGAGGPGAAAHGQGVRRARSPSSVGRRRTVSVRRSGPSARPGHTPCSRGSASSQGERRELIRRAAQRCGSSSAASAG
mmetsp:Transcript_84730/g.263189  ORF Transcript_84730/g.263189 Transcript_84730/m.263189 type:complete len:213 (-) Transcript_84730:274-912(-)